MRALLLISCLTLCAAAPERELFPRLSPHATVSQTIGTTTLSLAYDRPAVRGRKVWGGLVPYGQIWRSGANWATTITFSDAVKVEGRAVPAGTYALFTVPGPEHWTIILNRRARQWGAFEYQPKDDVLRFEARTKLVKDHTEWLTYEVYPASRASAYVDLYWEKLRVSFLVEVDVDAQVAARLKRAMAQAKPGDWKLYADAAEYFLEQYRLLGQALGWADRSIAIQENPVNLGVKARLLRALGRPAEAVQALERALKVGRAQKASAAILGPLAQTLDAWRREGTGGR